VLKLWRRRAGRRGSSLGNDNNFFFGKMEEREKRVPLALFPPFKKKGQKKREKKEKIRETKRERVVASIKKKTKRALFLFLSSFSRVNMAVTLSGSRFSGAFSSRDSAIINGTSALRGCLFFYYFFRGAFSPNVRKTKQREKKKVGRRQKKETKSRVAMATIRRSFAKRHSESTLCRSFPVHPLSSSSSFFFLSWFSFRKAEVRGGGRGCRFLFFFSQVFTQFPNRS